MLFLKFSQNFQFKHQLKNILCKTTNKKTFYGQVKSGLPAGLHFEGGSTRLTISGEGALLGSTRWRLGGRHPQLLRVRHYGRCDGLDLLSHRCADLIEGDRRRLPRSTKYVTQMCYVCGEK